MSIKFDFIIVTVKRCFLKIFLPVHFSVFKSSSHQRRTDPLNSHFTDLQIPSRSHWSFARRHFSPMPNDLDSALGLEETLGAQKIPVQFLCTRKLQLISHDKLKTTVSWARIEEQAEACSNGQLFEFSGSAWSSLTWVVIIITSRLHPHRPRWAKYFFFFF